MDNLLKLAELISLTERVDQPRKLQTALYLAQIASGCELYKYNVSRGRVCSDELVQDIAQLEASGLLIRRNSEAADEPSELIATSREGRKSWLEAGERELSKYLNQLLSEDTDILEAAATCVFFTKERRGNPELHLEWFRELPDRILKRASELGRAVI